MSCRRQRHDCPAERLAALAIVAVVSVCAGAAVGVDVQPAVEVRAEDGEQRLVQVAVGGRTDRHPQIDPHAVRHAVAVVVHVPLAGPPRNAVPKGIEIGIAAGEIGMVEIRLCCDKAIKLTNGPRHDLPQ